MWFTKVCGGGHLFFPVEKNFSFNLKNLRSVQLENDGYGAHPDTLPLEKNQSRRHDPEEFGLPFPGSRLAKASSVHLGLITWDTSKQVSTWVKTTLNTGTGALSSITLSKSGDWY